MKLVVDVGNSRIKWARVHDGGLDAGAGFERREPVEAALDAGWRGLERPAAVLVSSVAGERFDALLARWITQRWDCRPGWFRSQPETLGVINGYADSARLGSDRWAALLGARELRPGPVAVLDCGTALTLDVVDGADRHLGGLIVPGPDLARRSLSTGTANIRESTAAPVGLLGRNTTECVVNGTLLGLAGAVERWMADVDELVGGAAWLATGGAWPQVGRLVTNAVDYDPDLVLRGLARVLE